MIALPFPSLLGLSLAPLAWWGVTRTTWAVLWVILATVTVALIVLFRTRWKHVRPWRRCAVLSLWVHVLLACLATTVRIVSGSPGLGEDQPIQIAILPAEAMAVDDAPTETVTAESAPKWEEPEDPPLVEPIAPPLPDPAVDAIANDETTPDASAMNQLVQDVVLPADSSPAPPLEAPDLLAAPEPPPAPVETPAESETAVVEAPPAEPAVPHLEPTETSAAVGPSPVPPAAELAAQFAGRFSPERDELVVRGGGNAQTELAVRSALAWLAGAQSDDGRWDASRHGAGDERVVLGHNRQSAGVNADTGVTGLALLALLGAGHTHQHGSYPNQVAGGLDFLRRVQAPNGALHGDAQFFARMYCHSMAAFAAAEAYALTRDDRLAPVVDAAIGYSLAAQHPSDGGWRYQPQKTGDTSQLGWQLMALESAELAGVQIPETTWTRVERFLRRVRRGAHGGLAAYRPEAAPSRTMTGEAFYCRQLLVRRYRGAVPIETVHEAVRSLLRTTPTPQHVNLYYWYYATLALHHAQHTSPEAAAAWQSWNDALTRSLLSTQNDDGSWPSSTVWGGYGGRVYTTAMAALCLEVYYRYDPVAAQQTHPPGVAGRGWRPVR